MCWERFIKHLDGIQIYVSKRVKVVGAQRADQIRIALLKISRAKQAHVRWCTPQDAIWSYGTNARIPEFFVPYEYVVCDNFSKPYKRLPRGTHNAVNQGPCTKMIQIKQRDARYTV